MLADNNKRHPGNRRAILAGYNGGFAQGDMVAAGKSPSFKETRGYLDRADKLDRLPAGASSRPESSGSSQKFSFAHSVTLQDQHGMPLFDPIVQTQNWSPVPAGMGG